MYQGPQVETVKLQAPSSPSFNPYFER